MLAQKSLFESSRLSQRLNVISMRDLEEMNAELFDRCLQTFELPSLRQRKDTHGQASVSAGIELLKTYVFPDVW